jgi:hypothetical protein
MSAIENPRPRDGRHGNARAVKTIRQNISKSKIGWLIGYRYRMDAHHTSGESGQRADESGLPSSQRHGQSKFSDVISECRNPIRTAAIGLTN